MSILASAPGSGPGQADTASHGHSRISFGGSRLGASWNSPGRGSGRATFARCAGIAPKPAREGKPPVVLVDSSVLIEVFRRPCRLQLPAIADMEETATCLPVVRSLIRANEALQVDTQPQQAACDRSTLFQKLLSREAIEYDAAMRCVTEGSDEAR
jgi:hypothetical protein